jgi:dolichyl-phosphate-mannose-protein mannosyltransferase
VRGRSAIPLTLLIVASVAIRAAYFRQLDHSPLIQMYRWSQTDMHYYDGWARQIAAGDWASAQVRIPMHRWHREIAEAYLGMHPDVRAVLEREAKDAPEGPDARERLWMQWMRTPRFYQDPLYPYAIASIYRAVAADARWVIAAQLAVGVMTNVLVWWIARRYFGEAAGVCAAALAVLCAPLLFYEGLLLRDSLIAFTGLAIVWMTDRARQSRGVVSWFLLGLALGVACLLKSSFLLLAAALAAGVVEGQVSKTSEVGGQVSKPADPVPGPGTPRRGRPRRGSGLQNVARRCQVVPRLTATAAGLTLVLAMLAVRNVSVGAAPLSLASSGPLTFVASNEPTYLPEVGFGIDAPVLVDFLGSTDGGWRAAIVRGVAGHSVSSYAALLWRKWDRAWHWFEIPNNENFYYARMQAPVLAWLPVTFWVVGPLALAGLVLGARRAGDAWPLYALVASTLTSLVVFYVLGRFRVALLAAVLPFAGLTLAEFGRCVRRRHPGRAAAVFAATLVAALWVDRPLAERQLLVRTSDWILPWSVDYQDRVYAALDRKAYAEAAAAYLEFFARYEPGTAQILSSGDPGLAPELADMHRECGQILAAAREPALAAAQQEDARRILRLRPIR